MINVEEAYFDENGENVSPNAADDSMVDGNAEYLDETNDTEEKNGE